MNELDVLTPFTSWFTCILSIKFVFAEGDFDGEFFWTWDDHGTRGKGEGREVGDLFMNCLN